MPRFGREYSRSSSRHSLPPFTPPSMPDSFYFSYARDLCLFLQFPENQMSLSYVRATLDELAEDPPCRLFLHRNRPLLLFHDRKDAAAIESWDRILCCNSSMVFKPADPLTFEPFPRTRCDWVVAVFNVSDESVIRARIHPLASMPVSWKDVDTPRTYKFLKRCAIRSYELSFHMMNFCGFDETAYYTDFEYCFECHSLPPCNPDCINFKQKVLPSWNILDADSALEPRYPIPVCPYETWWPFPEVPDREYIELLQVMFPNDLRASRSYLPPFFEYLPKQFAIRQ